MAIPSSGAWHLLVVPWTSINCRVCSIVCIYWWSIVCLLTLADCEGPLRLVSLAFHIDVVHRAKCVSIEWQGVIAVSGSKSSFYNIQHLHDRLSLYHPDRLWLYYWLGASADAKWPFCIVHCSCHRETARLCILFIKCRNIKRFSFSFYILIKRWNQATSEVTQCHQ